jgi:hypothetical protein
MVSSDNDSRVLPALKDGLSEANSTQWFKAIQNLGMEGGRWRIASGEQTIPQMPKVLTVSQTMEQSSKEQATEEGEAVARNEIDEDEYLGTTSVRSQRLKEIETFEKLSFRATQLMMFYCGPTARLHISDEEVNPAVILQRLREVYIAINY